MIFCLIILCTECNEISDGGSNENEILKIFGKFLLCKEFLSLKSDVRKAHLGHKFSSL